MHYYVGWDVGGWNCDKNRNSRDAVAVLGTENGELRVLGTVFRGNIRETINRYSNLADIVNARCETDITREDHITIAIDTPLGLPEAIFTLLQNGYVVADVPDDYKQNPYLYRSTERWLFGRGFRPLSAIMHMIGSQATKGMHVLRKLGLATSDSGVWRSASVTALETYPTPCKRSPRLTNLFGRLDVRLPNEDRDDAVYCGLVAYLFETDKGSLVGPVDNPPNSEGWIWIPTDAVPLDDPRSDA